MNGRPDVPKVADYYKQVLPDQGWYLATDEVSGDSGFGTAVLAFTRGTDGLTGLTLVITGGSSRGDISFILCPPGPPHMCTATAADNPG